MRRLCFIYLQWKPISTAPVPTNQHIVHLILEQKSASQALETFRWASKLPNFSHSQNSYRALIHKLCIFRRLDIVKQLLDEMPSSIGSPPDEDIFITIVRGLGRGHMIKQVISVLDLVSKFGKIPSLKLYNSILDVLVKEDIDIAREFYRKKMMRSGLQGDDYTYGILMKGLCLTNRIGDGFKLLQLMKTRGIKPNTVIYNTLIHALCKNGKVGRARSLMNEVKDPNDVTFNILISAYCHEQNLVQALVILEKSFNNGFVPDMVSVTKVLDLMCNESRASDAFELLERVEGKGGTIDVVAYNTLIKGFCRLGKVKVGSYLLKEMELKGCLPNIDTYNTLIFGYCNCGMLDSALDLFNEMKMVGISWNFFTFDTLIHGLCSAGRMDDAYKFLELMEESKITGAHNIIRPYNSIIYGLCKSNRFDEALEFLIKMKMLFPRTVDKSLQILRLCDESNTEEAKSVYFQMKEECGIIPCTIVYTNMIHTFSQRKDCTKEALELLDEMISHGYFPQVSTVNDLISSFCRQGKVWIAEKFLKDMKARGFLPNCESYNPMITELCKKGDFQTALMSFLHMVEMGIVPDYSSWNSLVNCLCRDKNGMMIIIINKKLQNIMEI